MDYYDIDDILRTEELLPVTFTHGAEGMGWLDPNNRTESPDLAPDAKILLPAWLAEQLALKRNVTVRIPKSHSNQTRNELKADPSVFSMRAHPYFYDIGLLLVRTGADANELHQVIKQTFRGRFEMILDNAQNWRGEDHVPFTETLTDNESRLFMLGYRSTGDFDKWRRHKEEPLEPSATILALNSYVNAKKRKRD
eukprot:TRINITY_DN8923_c0_g1_i1.p1 TRINITY_DN8923_c0_g1~~TRINITY_DN8923_c0_g1_i1.p1  ORF type:complete len:196 (+),score=35.41 TRINITY_DN8923_c0_g1_i1:43-630(+)